MIRLMQYMAKPTPTRQMSESWSSQILSPTLPSKVGKLLGGRGRLLYHAICCGDAHGIKDVKKLSNESESAADQAHMNRTSESVCASFPDVRQRPRGRPKYSKYMAIITCTSVRGANMIMRVGELPTAPISPFWNSQRLIRTDIPSAAQVKEMFITRNNKGT